MQRYKEESYKSPKLYKNIQKWGNIELINPQNGAKGCGNGGLYMGWRLNKLQMKQNLYDFNHHCGHEPQEISGGAVWVALW